MERMQYTGRICLESNWTETIIRASQRKEKYNILGMLYERSGVMIKDSGDRTEFDTGAVRDMHEGKGRCDLLPLEEVCGLIHHEQVGDVMLTGTPLLLLDQYLKSIRSGSDAWIDEHIFYCALIRFAKQNKWDVPTMLLEASVHFEQGAAKYGEYNWQKGIPAHSYVDSAIRHYLKWLRGDDDERHDRAFVWNMLCLMWTLKNRPECNDLKESDRDVD